MLGLRLLLHGTAQHQACSLLLLTAHLTLDPPSVKPELYGSTPHAQEFAAKGSFIQYGGVVDHALVVRGISTVYNTDYITDVTFHLNGAIEARWGTLALRRLNHTNSV